MGGTLIWVRAPACAMGCGEVKECVTSSCNPTMISRFQIQHGHAAQVMSPVCLWPTSAPPSFRAYPAPTTITARKDRHFEITDAPYPVIGTGVGSGAPGNALCITSTTDNLVGQSILQFALIILKLLQRGWHEDWSLCK